MLVSIASLLILFSLLGVGVLAVLYGTVVKNKWGINLEPVCCPRCNTPLPALREPHSFRQAAWGGWTCPVCGAGVDKWGREVAPAGPPTRARTEEETRRLLKKRFILAAPGLFCLFVALDWTGLSGSGFPSNWAQALVQVCANIGCTVFFTVISYLVVLYLLKRRRPDKGDHAPEEGRKPD